MKLQEGLWRHGPLNLLRQLDRQPLEVVLGLRNGQTFEGTFDRTIEAQEGFYVVVKQKTRQVILSAHDICSFEFKNLEYLDRAAGSPWASLVEEAELSGFQFNKKLKDVQARFQTHGLELKVSENGLSPQLNAALLGYTVLLEQIWLKNLNDNFFKDAVQKIKSVSIGYADGGVSAEINGDSLKICTGLKPEQFKTEDINKILNDIL